MSMDCKQCDPLLAAYVRDELTLDECTLVEEHIRHCESCRWNAEAARHTLDELERATEPSLDALVRQDMIQAASDAQASDIHIEPERDAIRVRIRVDGVLRELTRLPKHLMGPIFVHLCTLAELNPFERRVPQLGRSLLEVGGRRLWLRVSTMPATMGARLVCRLLDAEAQVMSLAETGLSETNRARLERMVRSPLGLLLVCGPPGSGRTSLLYALLQHLNHDEVSILTVENPVELSIPGIGQMHLNRKMGLDYPTALRGLMAQDPDIIMAADVPDSETGTALLQAALTGHLVLAGMLAQDAAEGIGRLLHMGVDRLVAGHVVLGAVATRLLRRICEECRKDVAVTAAEREGLQAWGLAEVPDTLVTGEGCPHCRHTGYYGRIGVQEVLAFEGPMVDFEVPPEELRAAIRPSLALDAAEKVAAGITDFAEALRVVGPAG